MTMGIATVAAITALVYIAGLGIKASKLDSKWIPVICGGFGAVLGIIGYLTGMPDFPAKDVVSAAAVGSVSGLAATGIDQMVRQMKQ